MSFTTLKDALNELHTKQPCNIEFVALDVSRKTGGEIMQLYGASEVGQSSNSWQNNTITVRVPGHKHPYTIHIHLIRRFNGKLIVW